MYYVNNFDAIQQNIISPNGKELTEILQTAPPRPDLAFVNQIYLASERFRRNNSRL